MNAPKHRAVPDHDPSDLQADIERTRQELGSTIDELTAKFDVRTRAKHGAQDASARLRRAVEPVTARIGGDEFVSQYGGAVLAATGVLLLLLVGRRRRARRHR